MTTTPPPLPPYITDLLILLLTTTPPTPTQILPHPQSLTPTDSTWRKIVIFLEDTYIRALPVDKRKGLREHSPPITVLEGSPEMVGFIAGWNREFKVYLGVLGVEEGAGGGGVVIKAVEGLHGDLFLEEEGEGGAMGKDVATVLSPSALPPTSSINDLLSNFPLGFASPSANVDQQLKKLKILHLNELCNLQKEINAFVSNLQDVTVRQAQQGKKREKGEAGRETGILDYKKGKVGR